MSQQAIEYLDPAIANEGESADVDFVAPVQAQIPQYEGLKKHKHYAKYFAPYKHKPYPAWLYHPTDPPVLVKNAAEAEKLGVVWRASTPDEIGAGFPPQRWDFKPGSWRPNPYAVKFDPTGKEIVHGSAPAPSSSELVAAVVAAVIAQMGGVPSQNGGNALAARGDITSDPEYAEFLRFKQFKASERGPGDATGGELSKSERKAVLIKLAEEKGIEVDGRWSLEKIEETLAKAAPSEE